MKRVLGLFVITCAAVCTILVLVAIVKFKGHQKNGFSRNFFTKKIRPINTCTPDLDIASVAGFEGDSVFFTSDEPGHFMISNKNLDDTHHFKVNFGELRSVPPVYFLSLSYPYLKFLFGNEPCVINYDIVKKVFTKFAIGQFFNRAVCISSESMIVRSIAAHSFNPVFKKIAIKRNEVDRQQGFGENLGDAGFSSDGMMHYDSANSRLYYLNYYNNHLICFDTSLNLVFRKRTIDTLSGIHTQTIRLIHDRDTTITFSQPPQRVNASSDIYDGNLFVASMLIADNENRSSFDENSVIDVYALSNGVYKGSFYVPNIDGKRLYGFKVSRNGMYALYGKKIVLYQMAFH